MIMKKEFKEILNLTDSVEFFSGSLLIAGPTCGKSYLQKKSKFVIHDSDDVIAEFFPEWWDKPRVDPNVTMYKAVAWMMRVLNHGTADLWVTNLWGKDFLKVLFGKYSYRKVIFVYRDNPVEIKRIYDQLGKEITLATLESWVKTWDKYAKVVSANVIVLKDGEYLSDVVEPTARYWRIRERSKK